MPDLFTYWLSGVRIAETTMASTTGLLDVHSRQWSDALLDVAGVRRELLPELVTPGTLVGGLDVDVERHVRAESPIEVVAVGSHDTASAVTAIPMQPETAAFISCGTWGLAGVELDSPVVTEAARTGGFTNEVGVDGRILLMRNVMGLWILSEAVRQWERDGDTISLPELIEAATAISEAMPVVDVDDPRFLAPGNMPRHITESLAQAFADAVLSAGALGDVPVQTIHISGSLDSLRDLVQRTHHPVTYSPR